MEKFSKFDELHIYAGSIIRFGSTVGHVRNVENGIAIVDAYYEDKDLTKLIIRDFEVTEKTRNLENANELLAKFMDDLFDMGYSINIADEIIKLPSLHPGTWVSATKNSSIPSHGVILQMDKRDLVIGYPDKRSGLKQVKYKIDYGTDIRLITLKEKKKSLATLESFGYVWDEAAMWVSAPRPRMRAGGTYWYITDRFTLRAAQDNQTPQHNQRYECGNYFLTPEDARELLNVILEKIAATR